MSLSQSDLHIELKQRLRFEELLADISTKFINLPVEQIDSAIEDTQRKICECLGFDLSVLWQWSDESGSSMTITHLYSPSDGPERPEKIDGAEVFPWAYRHLMSGRTLVVSSEKAPPEAAQDQATWRYFGIKSSVGIPLSAGGRPIFGVLSFDTLHTERCPDQDEVKRLELVAQIFANALVRKAMEEMLRRNEERLSLAADFAAAGIWEFDYAAKTFWATPQALNIFGFRPGEQVSLAQFEDLIHPDDLDLVRRAISCSFENGEVVDIEYRILVQPTVQKWISSRGRPQLDCHGKPIRLLGLSIDISRQKHLENKLKERLEEVDSLKQQLEAENYFLREDLRIEQGFEQIVGNSKALHAVLMKARQVAPTDATVLILGETGTGKGLLADAIHRMSPRRNHAFITVNCAALPPDLIESELFGREKGAFTGAHARQAGRFEVADRGTIFLDEVGDIPLEVQGKLLRVLQEGEFERLGSTRTMKINMRVIVATNKDLREEVRNRRFREDLFYRINVFPLTIPPLRQRTEDIPLLIQHFLKKYADRMGKSFDAIPKTVLKKILHYRWPGNIRELEHLVERSVIISSGNTLVIGDQIGEALPILSSSGPGLDLASMERNHITEVLRETGWKIDGPGGAATILNIHPSTLRFRMKKLGIQRPV